MQYRQRYKAKRYRTYLLESPVHYESIISKYGMPRKSHPPKFLTEQTIAIIRKQQRADWKSLTNE